MHFPTKLLIPVALAFTVVPGLKTIAKAQQPEPSPPEIALSLPRCARPAQHELVSAIGCKIDDSECICSKNKNFLPRLLGMTSQSCSTSDQEAVKQFGAAYCMIDPSKVTTVPKTTPTVLHTPTVTYKCSPVGTEEGNRPTASTASAIGGKPSTKPTKTSQTKKSKPTNGSPDGRIGNIGARVESGLSAAALIGIVAATGWVFAEL